MAVWLALVSHGYSSEADPAIIQCFDLEALERLRGVGCQIRMVWLMSEEPSDNELEVAAAFCHGLGPNRKLLEDDSGQPTPLLARVREMGLALYPYTFKDEPEATARFFHEHKVDGLFTDFPGVGRRAADRAGQATPAGHP